MERHVSLLGILASLWGALAVIIGMDQVATSTRMNRAARSHTSV